MERVPAILYRVFPALPSSAVELLLIGKSVHGAARVYFIHLFRGAAWDLIYAVPPSGRYLEASSHLLRMTRILEGAQRAICHEIPLGLI